LEQNADTNQRRLTRQTNPPEIREQENERNAQAMATRCTDLAYRILEQLLILIKEDWHVLIQHTGYQSKLLILIKEDWQESNHFFMKWQLSLIL
jgi:hypothetical protein